MSLYDWIEKMRKKPIAHRKRFAAVTTILIMAIITALWFIFFFLNFGNELKKIPPAAPVATTTPETSLPLPATTTPETATSTDPAATSSSGIPQ